MNSSNSGFCPGSTQPLGLFIRAMLNRDSLEFTRPTNSSISFGLFPAAVIRVGDLISVGISLSALMTT